MNIFMFIVHLFVFGSFFFIGYVFYPTNEHTDTETRFYWYNMTLFVLLVITNVTRWNRLYLIGLYLFCLGLVYYIRFILHPINIQLSLLNSKSMERLPSNLYQVPNSNSRSVLSVMSFTLVKGYTVLLSFFILLTIYEFFKNDRNPTKLPRKQFRRMDYYSQIKANK